MEGWLNYSLNLFTFLKTLLGLLSRSALIFDPPVWGSVPCTHAWNDLWNGATRLVEGKLRGIHGMSPSSLYQLYWYLVYRLEVNQNISDKGELNHVLNP